MKAHEFDLYTDYPISQFGATTATGLSALLDGEIGHDKVTRFLSERLYAGKDLWLQVKPVIRRIEDEEGCLIIDDTIQEKAWADENDLICRHFDRCSGLTVKGIDLLNALYYVCDTVRLARCWADAFLLSNVSTRAGMAPKDNSS